MEAAAHTVGGFDNVPSKVGREFLKADAKAASKAPEAALGKKIAPKQQRRRMPGFGR